MTKQADLISVVEADIERRRRETAEQAAIKTKQLEEERRRAEEALELLNYEQIKYSEEELRYFREQATKITNYLFLADYAYVKGHLKELMNKHGVTHIVNCSAQENHHTDQFTYLNLSFPLTAPRPTPPPAHSPPHLPRLDQRAHQAVL